MSSQAKYRFRYLDEYKADIRKKLQEKKEQDAKVENKNNVIEKSS